MTSRTIIQIALFGSLWGFIEATLGGVLHLALVPFTGTIMASVGFAILFAAMRSGVKPVQLPLIAIVAASFKFLDVPLFGLPLFAITVVNPAVAIASQGLAFALLFGRAPQADRIASLAPRMLGAAALSIVLFNAISVFGFNWQTNQTQHPLNTVLVQLPLMVLYATAFSLLIGCVRFTLSAGWQAAAAAACAVLAVVVRCSL
jgi:hypothetical protein